MFDQKNNFRPTLASTGPSKDWLKTRFPFSWHRRAIAMRPSKFGMFSKGRWRRNTFVQNHVMYESLVRFLHKRCVLEKNKKLINFHSFFETSSSLIKRRNGDDGAKISFGKIDVLLALFNDSITFPLMRMTIFLTQ